MHFDWTVGALAAGLDRYQAGEFFSAHEEWEGIWLQAQEPEKTFLQGLIQVTAAFHHWQHGNPQGCLRLLRAALRRIKRYPEDFGGLDVLLLSQEILRRIELLESAQPPSSLDPVPIRPRHSREGSTGRDERIG